MFVFPAFNGAPQLRRAFYFYALSGGKAMAIRESSTPEARRAPAWRGQRWLPLIAFVLLPFDAFAFDAPGDLRVQVDARFRAMREDQVDLARIHRQLQIRHRQLQDGSSVLLAQVQVEAEPAMAGQRLAQAEPAPANRGVVQLLNQVEALNGELNRLRGQMEVLSNDVANAQKRQRDMYVDLDTRLRRIEQSSASRKDQEAIAALEERIRKLEQGAATMATIPQPVSAAAVVPPVNSPVAGAQSPAAAANADASATPPPGSSLPPASLAANDQAAVQRAYDNAYSNYRLGDYPNALRGFESFLKSFPAHALAPNAQYWIGESHARQRQYREAIEAERRLLVTYPDSAKSPDALLIIGTAESSLGDSAAARKTFEDLIAKYPASDAAEKARTRLAKLK